MRAWDCSVRAAMELTAPPIISSILSSRSPGDHRFSFMVEILQSVNVREEPIHHEHPHGQHTHVHAHPGGDQHHYHGWHATADICTGDDTFGEEEGGPREPNLKEPELLRIAPGLVVVMPYIGGMDSPKVIEAVMSQPCTVVRQDVS